MRATREQWRKRVERWKDSGLSAAEFATETGINVNSLRCWKSILNRQSDPHSEPGRLPRTAGPRPQESLPLIEVQPTAAATDKHFELQLGRGWRLHVPYAFESQVLRQLLGVLQEVA